MKDIEVRVRKLLDEGRNLCEIGRILREQRILYTNLEGLVGKILNIAGYDFIIQQLWKRIKVLLTHLKRTRKDKVTQRALKLKENRILQRISWRKRKDPSFSLDYEKIKKEFQMSLI